MAGGGGNKKRFQYCTDSSGQEILYLPALQSHSGRNPIDPPLQDNVLIPNNFFKYNLSHRMCDQFKLRHEFRIDGGRTKFQHGQTDGILYGRESHGQGTQRSVRAWLDQTTSCMVQAEEVERTPRNAVLGRLQHAQRKGWILSHEM